MPKWPSVVVAYIFGGIITVCDYEMAVQMLTVELFENFDIAARKTCLSRNEAPMLQ
jgi:hypothetical protein